MTRRMKYIVLTAGILAVVSMTFAGSGCSNKGGSAFPVGTGTVAASSKGVITGFGSVFVNGVEYDTAGASVIMDDSPASESGLQLGMVVTVRGTLDASGTTGTAESVSFADNLEGPVSGLYDPANGTLAVMGQPVKVNGSTVYHNVNDASLLALNDMVEVSGFPDSGGAILATRIERKAVLFAAGMTVVEIKGPVSGLAGNGFSINSLNVNAGGVALPAGLANGSFVEVRGTLAAAGGPLTAMFLEIEPSFSAGEGVHVEIEGIVTDYVSMSSFKVNGVQVDGSALSGLAFANNMKVEVEGRMSGGVLMAREGEIEQEDNVLLEGNVSSVGTGTLTVLGQTASVTATTEFKDGSAQNVRAFGLANIAPGDHVIVVGYQGAGGIVASSVERSDASTQAQMKGVVSAATATTSLTILGVSVDTSSASFRDISNTTIAAADFFNAITPGTTVVKVKWNAFNATNEPVHEAELESIP